METWDAIRARRNVRAYEDRESRADMNLAILLAADC